MEESLYSGQGKKNLRFRPSFETMRVRDDNNHGRSPSQTVQTFSI